jgi:hypothetical protein
MKRFALALLILCAADRLVDAAFPPGTFFTFTLTASDSTGGTPIAPPNSWIVKTLIVTSNTGNYKLQGSNDFTTWSDVAGGGFNAVNGTFSFTDAFVYLRIFTTTHATPAPTVTLYGNLNGPSGGATVTLGYNTVQQAGVSQTQRHLLNFASGATCVDNSGTGATDCTISGGSSSTQWFSWVDFAHDAPSGTYTHNGDNATIGMEYVLHGPKGSGSTTCSITGIKTFLPGVTTSYTFAVYDRQSGTRLGCHDTDTNVSTSGVYTHTCATPVTVNAYEDLIISTFCNSAGSNCLSKLTVTAMNSHGISESIFKVSNTTTANGRIEVGQQIMYLGGSWSTTGDGNPTSFGTSEVYPTEPIFTCP